MQYLSQTLNFAKNGYMMFPFSLLFLTCSNYIQRMEQIGPENYRFLLLTYKTKDHKEIKCVTSEELPDTNC